MKLVRILSHRKCNFYDKKNYVTETTGVAAICGNKDFFGVLSHSKSFQKVHKLIVKLIYTLELLKRYTFNNNVFRN